MEILIVLALAAGTLYSWLAGNWFARVLVFLIGTVAGGSLLTIAMASPSGVGNPLGFLIGGIAAWFVASVPIYRQRHQKRQAQRAKQFVYPLHWTLTEINACERDRRPYFSSPTAAAECRQVAHFPVLRLR